MDRKKMVEEGGEAGDEMGKTGEWKEIVTDLWSSCLRMV